MKPELIKCQSAVGSSLELIGLRQKVKINFYVLQALSSAAMRCNAASMQVDAGDTSNTSKGQHFVPNT